MDSSRQLSLRKDLRPHVDGQVSKSTEFTREKNSVWEWRGDFFFSSPRTRGEKLKKTRTFFFKNSKANKKIFLSSRKKRFFFFFLR